MFEKRWILLLVLALAVAAAPGLLEADLVCPECEPHSAPLSVAEVVDLVFSTLIRHGISILLVGATAVVAIPWMIAGAAAALIYLPHRFKSS